MNDIERKKLLFIIEKHQSNYSLEKHRSKNIEEHTNEFIRVVENEFKNIIGALRYSETEYESHTRVVLASIDISKILSKEN